MIGLRSLSLLAQASATQPDHAATRAIALIWLTAILAVIGVVVIALLVLSWGRFTSRNFNPRRKRTQALPNDKPDIWHESAERLKLEDDNNSPRPPANG